MPDIHPIAEGSCQTVEPGEQTELLKRGLVRVSIAASGIDPLLDKRLNELRRALRADAPPSMLADLLPKLEHAVLTADQKRQERASNIAKSLQTIIEQLQDSEPPKDAAKALRTLGRRLTDLGELPRQLDSILGDLQQLQGEILQFEPEAETAGLWGRLFGRGERRAGNEPSQADPLPEASEQLAHHEDDQAGPVEPEQPAITGVISGEQQSFSQVAAHIESILLNLLNELQVIEVQQTIRDRLREQVSRGLNWYELAALLDSLTGLILGAQQSRQAEFEGYLQQLNQRLSQFQGNLEEAHTNYNGSLEAERELAGDIRNQVADLNENVRDADDLSSLKANVELRLNSLLENIDRARELREERDNKVSQQLTTMVERIQVMEVEAQTFRRHLEEQRRQAMIDSLTGLANRAGLQRRMEEEHERWQRYGGRLLLVVLDVDHFKSINDRFGHLAGDKVLRLIAQQLSRRLRKTDFIGRFGGEEFVILMPGVTPEQGATALEELRNGIEHAPFHFKNEPVPVTISIGFTEFREGDTLDSTFERADRAMYQAKEAGRNRIVAADSP